MIPLTCKVDYAVYVNLNMPIKTGLINGFVLLIVYNSLYMLNVSRLSSNNYLDTDYITAYIILHL